VKNGKPRNRPRERHIQSPQAIGLADRDPAGLNKHDVVELKALGQRDGHDRQPTFT